MNTTTRIGKIARLPHSLREQLNLRLHDNEPQKTILPWLNSLPEAKAILAADFDNRPITKQNLSEWKQGGHRDWLLLYHASHFLQFADSSSFSSSSSSSISAPSIKIPPSEVPTTTSQPDDSPSQVTNHVSRITSKLLLWTQLQYTTMARHIDAETDPERKWTALRQFANDISRLRRSSLADDFLQIQRDWLALSQSNTADKKEKDFWKWTKRPDIEKKLFPDRRPGMTAEQLYQFEKDTCLMDGPGPEIAELMAEVRIARKLLELRKAQEAEAKAKAAPDYDPNRPLPDTKVRLAGMPFEELFPTIPDKPLTETHPELDDDMDSAIPDSNADIPVGANADRVTGESAPSGEEDSDRSDSLSSTGGEGRGEEANSSTANSPVAPPQVDQSSSDPSDLSHQSDSSDSSGKSNPVQPNPTESNQIQPPSPLDPEPNPNNENPF